MADRMDHLKAYGGTALRNAVAYCHRLLIENVGKKGVLLLSDGLDNRSDFPLGEALAIAAQGGIADLHLRTGSKPVCAGRQKDDRKSMCAALKAFAEATGGLYFTLEEASPEGYFQSL